MVCRLPLSAEVQIKYSTHPSTAQPSLGPSLVNRTMNLSLFFLLRWHEFKRGVRVTKNSVSRATKKRTMAVKHTAMATKNKVKTAKIAVSRAAKDQVLAIPGISKIKLPEPPFPYLLQSNAPPTDLEETNILEVISTVEAQFLYLQEITQERGPDRMVEHQLDRARQFMHAHRGVLSAIRRIPPEVLQEIFCQTILPWGDYIQRNAIPWALSQVCQPWRATALSITSLWSKLPTIYLHKKTPRSYVAQIEELLLRSRNAPISFYLYAPLKDWESHPIIDALTRHSDRWQAVIINSTSLTISAFKSIKGRLSSLRSLSLEIWRQTDSSIFVDLFEDAPQLRVVHLYGPFPGEIRLPFSQLTRYKERVRGRGMVDHTISLATSLTSLEISRFFESPDIPVTTLPFLVTLKVQFDTFQHGFLHRLTLPVIQEIWIAGYGANLITDMIDMISRSHLPSTLKKFAFRVSGLGELDPGELTRLLRLTPHLVALNLPLPPLEDLANLVIGRNDRPLVPLLQTLTIEADAIRRPETGQLLNAIAVSRCTVQGSLTSVVLHPPDDLQPLKELRVIFKAPTVCHHELRYLEGWVPSEESEQLVIWKENLLQELPELQWPAFRKRKFDPKWRDRVFDIFSDIEKFQVKNVTDIYVSEVHIILRRLTNQPIRSVLSQFGDRAGEILEIWSPLFESHIKERRWVLKGDFSLVYFSSDDALRLSSTGLDIVYGLEDNLRFPEIFWPIYMLY